MKKALKIFGIIVFLLFAAVLVLPFAFKGKIVDTIKTEASNSLLAKVDFGDFSLSLIRHFPDFTFEVENLSVVGTEVFEGDTLVFAPLLSVTIDLMSVFKGDQYQLKNLLVKDPFINILVKKINDTTFAYNYLIAKEDSLLVEAPEETATPFSMKLQQLSIENAHIVYEDQELVTFTKILGFNHSLTGDLTESFTSLATITSAASVDLDYEGIRYLSKASLDMRANIGAQLDSMVFTFKDNEIRINELYLACNGSFAMPEQGYLMDLDFEAKKNTFKNFLSMVPAVYSTDFAEVKTAGSMTLSGYVKGLYSDESMPAVGINLVVADGQFQYPGLPKAVKNVQIDTRVESKTGKEDDYEVDVRKFHVEMGGNPFDMTLSLRTPVSDPAIEATINGRIDLGGIRDFYPLEEGADLSGIITASLAFAGKLSSIEQERYEAFKAAGEVTVNDMQYRSVDLPNGLQIAEARASFSPQNMHLQTFRASIGHSDFAATGWVDNILAYVLKDEVLKGQFTVSSRLLDLNQFMEDETAETAGTDTTALSVIEVPGNIDFVMSASLDKLLYDNMEMDHVIGKLIVRDQAVRMENLSMVMLGGSLMLTGIYETSNPAAPSFDFGMEIKGFDIQETFATFETVQKLAPVTQRAEGHFSTDMKLVALLGSDMMPVMSSMAGNGRLTTTDVLLKNSKAQDKIADALKIEELKQMKFKDLLIEFEIKDGKLVVAPTAIKLNNISATIAGYNAFDQTISYDINMKIPRRQMGGAANAVIDGLIRQANTAGASFSAGEMVDVNLGLTGTVLEPKVTTKLKETATSMTDDLKKQAQEELARRKQEAVDKAKAEAGKIKQEAEDKARAEAERLKAEAEKKKQEVEAKAKTEAERVKKEAESKVKDEAKKNLKKLW